MAHLIHARATFNTLGDRSDSVSNGFAFTWTGVSDPVDADYAALNSAIQAFYNTLYTSQVNEMSAYMSNGLSRATNASEVTMTDVTAHLDGSAAGSPFKIYQFTLNNRLTTAVDLPAQVAAVCSFRADYGTDPEFGSHVRPRASDRNRIYLGPLCTPVLDVDSETPPRTIFKASFLSDIHLALSGLYHATTGTGSVHWVWSIWSRKEAMFKTVTELSSDLIPDTNRRRADRRGNLVWATPS